MALLDSTQLASASDLRQAVKVYSENQPSGNDEDSL
jgi:hypothetical protein